MFVDEHGEPRAGGGFDAVIGNPPYIRVQEIGRGMANYCRSRFVYAGFIRCLRRLPRAWSQSIVPDRTARLHCPEQDFQARLRPQASRLGFSSRELVDEVIDFGASQVFAGATNYTCILVLDVRGVTELAYRRLIGTREIVLEGLSAADAITAEKFATKRFGSDPWVLVPPEEARVLRTAADGSERLDAVTRQIFQGLITSADDVYVLDDRGWRGDHRLVWSRASARELELEPELLHPLASGSEVARYTFRPPGSLLLFPYRRDADGMRLVSHEELGDLPLTEEYLWEHAEFFEDARTVE